MLGGSSSCKKRHEFKNVFFSKWSKGAHFFRGILVELDDDVVLLGLLLARAELVRPELPLVPVTSHHLEVEQGALRKTGFFLDAKSCVETLCKNSRECGKEAE